MAGKRMLYICLTLILAVLAYVGWKAMARKAYESAEYSVYESDGPFEIRDYPSLVMVTTPIKLNSQGDGESFMRLFEYISGANDREQKVAMTTPVFMESGGKSKQGQMGFVIPAILTEQHVPEPSSDDVQIQKRAGGRFAVFRFSGRMSGDSVAKGEEQLRSWIRQKGLNADGEVELAGYDPPWTPGPFRRNKVLIRLR